MPSWIQHPITGKLIPRDEYVRPNMNKCPAVHGDFNSFVSPIDQTLIDDRGKLRRHNKQHGVTDMRDYGVGYTQDRAKMRKAKETAELNSSRLNDIHAAIHKHGG